MLAFFGYIVALICLGVIVAFPGEFLFYLGLAAFLYFLGFFLMGRLK
jgi:hypothetical protein